MGKNKINVIVYPRLFCHRGAVQCLGNLSHASVPVFHPIFSLPRFVPYVVAIQAAGPSHPWLHFFGAHKAKPPAPEWRAAVATVTAAKAAAAKAAAATVVAAGVAHTSGGDRLSAAPRGRSTLRDSGSAGSTQCRDAGASRSSSRPAPPAWIHIGPVRLPMCFFGSVSRHEQHSHMHIENNGKGREGGEEVGGVSDTNGNNNRGSTPADTLKVNEVNDEGARDRTLPSVM